MRSGDECPPRTAATTRPYRDASSGAGAGMGDLGQGQAPRRLGTFVGGRADEFVAQTPQEALLVHGEGGEGDRLMGGFSDVGHRRRSSRRLGPRPLGGATIPTTMIPDGGSKSTRT